MMLNEVIKNYSVTFYNVTRELLHRILSDYVFNTPVHDTKLVFISIPIDRDTIVSKSDIPKEEIEHAHYVLADNIIRLGVEILIAAHNTGELIDIHKYTEQFNKDFPLKIVHEFMNVYEYELEQKYQEYVNYIAEMNNAEDLYMVMIGWRETDNIMITDAAFLINNGYF